MTQMSAKQWPWNLTTRMGLHHRSRRVTLLVASIVILSLADLIITLAYLRAHWMMEANPIAAWLIRYTQSSWTLVAYKCATMGTCVAVLYRLRKHAAGEAAAWCAVAILTVMSLMWHNYSRQFENPEDMVLAQTHTSNDSWLGLP
jgi:hypothetical protein